MVCIAPVTKEASGPASHATIPATSSGFPCRLIAMKLYISSFIGPSSGLMSVSMGPGCTTFIVISHLRGGVGGEVYKDSLAFSGNYYFPLTGWKTSAAHEFHDERPAYGFDLRTKGMFPDFPWFSGELTYEQYYGDKVDLLGNGTLSRNPRAAGAALVWNPVPLLEVRAGYRDAGNGGSQAEGGLRVNYSFGTPLPEQLDYRNVGAPSNTTNRRAFVDRNYDIVMAYREQASKIRITAMPVSGLSGTLVTLMATVDSRYPIEKVEWPGDAELIAGLQLQGSLGSDLILPQLSLTATDEATGSVTAPVVGTEMRARTLCINNMDCTDAFNYQWEISDEMKSWKSVPGATKATWLLPYSLNGESLQNKYIRVRIISDKENAKGNTATSDAN